MVRICSAALVCLREQARRVIGQYDDAVDETFVQLIREELRK